LKGHSLGGGIASIVGARNEIEAVGFSSPGIYLSYRKFGIKNCANIRRFVTNIVPNNDFVPMVDVQTGMLQHIDCEHLQTTMNSIMCHGIVHTICELISGCGLDDVSNVTVAKRMELYKSVCSDQMAKHSVVVPPKDEL
jgi:lipase ATG15